MAGYPGTIAATWQRAGRAGRRAEPIGGGHGGEQRAARSVRRPQPVVLLRRVARARADRSRQPAHPRRSHQVRGVRAAVHRDGAVRPARRAGDPRRPRRAGARAPARATTAPWTWTNESYPADAVSLRSVSSDNFVVVDTTRRDAGHRRNRLHQRPGDAASRRRSTSSKGSCIRWSGSTSRGARRSCARSTATTTRRRSPTRRSRRSTRSRTDASRQPSVRSHGEVHVVSRVVGFKKIKFYTNENVGSGELDLPEQQMHTTSYWLTIPASVMALLPYAADDRRDGVVGLAFAMQQVAQLLLMCDGHDIGISIDTGERRAGFGRTRRFANPTRARIFVYDNYPGGIGFSAPLFRMHDELLTGDAAPDCRVPVRKRLPGLRRADRQHRAAREGRGAADPRPACSGPQRHSRGSERSRAWRRQRCELSGRSHSRDRQHPAAGRVEALPAASALSCPTCPIRPSCRPARDLSTLGAATGAATASSSSAAGRHRRDTGERPSATFAQRLERGVRRKRRSSRTVPPARPPFVFFDLETTGLERRRGHVGVPRRLRLVRRRGRVRDAAVPAHAHARRAAAARAVAGELARAGALVSFNGKSFDAPLLETRYLFHRLEWSVALSAARRRAASGAAVLEPVARPYPPPLAVDSRELRRTTRTPVRCIALERHILGVRRTGDVPGFEIPARYFQFVRTGDADPLAAVLEHNRLDLLSLAALTARLFTWRAPGLNAARDAREALALGRVYARARSRRSRARRLQPRAGPLPLAARRLRPARIDALRLLALAMTPRPAA